MRRVASAGKWSILDIKQSKGVQRMKNKILLLSHKLYRIHSAMTLYKLYKICLNSMHKTSQHV